MHDLVEQLIAECPNPSPALIENLKDSGDDIVDSLLQLLNEPKYRMMNGPGKGIPAIYAVRLIVPLRTPLAINPMIEILKELDHLDVLYSDIIMNMPRMGRMIIEPTLKSIGIGESSEGINVMILNHDYTLHSGICSILSKCEVKDERIFQLLCRYVQLCPDIPGLLADYGDPRALSLLHELFSNWKLEEKNSNFGNLQTPIELEDAIISLDGELTAEESAKLEQSHKMRRRLLGGVAGESIEPEVSSERKLGRNELCWCGSGKKYKKCHLRQDKNSTEK